jgi:exodeoxyribonuclease VII large subunit
MSIEFSDGRVGAIADSDRPAATPAPQRPAGREEKPAPQKRATKPVDQGSLF